MEGKKDLFAQWPTNRIVFKIFMKNFCQKKSHYEVKFILGIKETICGYIWLKILAKVFAILEM